MVVKIVIVGGGIAGLSAYLHLRKHFPYSSSDDITIYESHRPHPPTSNSSPQDHPNQSVNLDALSESTAIVGGGLGIAPNGMRVLRDLSPDLHHRVIAQGFPVEKFIFQGANGWTLGMQSTGDGSVRAEAGTEEVCIASSRHGLWQTLRRYVTEKYGDDAIKHGKIVKVYRDESRAPQPLQVHLLDEQGMEKVVYADLVVGADGVKSIVRKYLFGDDERYQPTYSGQSGVGGFYNTTMPLIIADNKAMVFEFGGNGFFGYSSGGPASERQLMWWSTFETSSLPNTTDVDPRDIKYALLERYEHWKDPIIKDIIKNADVESIYPTWVMPDIPHWGEKGIVLIGDAAHALDPTTGQGASQAMEDAQTFALLLAEVFDVERYGSSHPKWAIDDAIEMYFKIRSPRVHRIAERGKKLAGSKARVGIVKEYIMYLFLWLLNKFPFLGKAMVGDTNRELYCWSAKEQIQKALKASQSYSEPFPGVSEVSPLLA